MSAVRNDNYRTFRQAEKIERIIRTITDRHRQRISDFVTVFVFHIQLRRQRSAADRRVKFAKQPGRTIALVRNFKCINAAFQGSDKLLTQNDYRKARKNNACPACNQPEIFIGPLRQ